MTKITMIKTPCGHETLRQVTLEELVSNLQCGTYETAVRALRQVWPLAAIGRNADGTIRQWTEYTRHLPRLCFAVEMESRKQQRHQKTYNGLVLLEVNNLTGEDEAEAVRRGASEMPQTLLAFVGASGLSVKIVCRGELFPADQYDGLSLPLGEQAVADFHQNLYERARLIYNGQLGVTIEKLEPLMQRVCYMSADTQVYYTPMAMPIYAHAEPPTEALVRQPSVFEKTKGRPGIDRYASLDNVYEYNLDKAYDAVEGITDENERTHALASHLARYCMETGIPMRVALGMALIKSSFWERRQMVEMVFQNAYREEHVRRFRERKGLEPTRHIAPEALLTMKIDIFLNANYELRKNVMRGVAEYRARTGIGFSFQDLTEEARNSITMRALEKGIRCWDKDIRRYVNSDDIARYDPVGDYLEHLPKWDGRDRVMALASRVPTSYSEWPRLFHLWLRSMVAMWQGKGQLTGNALVPLFVGRQGCGKSSVCRILLPRQLRDYYNDRISFKNESDLNLGLSSFALINLDEFDKITSRQQIVLKYLVSTADLKYRPPYGKAYQSHRRYASFIGTTNEPTPLTDPSGSRRFVCVSIEGDIDFESPVEHDQLFSQLLLELSNGERYWPTKDEERRLMEHNLQYQRLNGLGEMLMSIVRKPRTDDEPEARWMTMKELSALLHKHFSGYREEVGTFAKIGNYLNRPEYKFQSKRTAEGIRYLVVPRV